MIDPQVIQFSIAVAILTMTPGNDTVLVLRNAAGRGRMAGFATLLGVCAGLFVHAAMGIVWLSGVVIMVGFSREILARPAVKRRFDTATGLVLIAFGLRLALEDR